MSERTLLGTAVTNSNGIATLEYVGTGAGDMNIVAVAGEVESNILQVEDYEPIATAINAEALTPLVQVGESISISANLLDQHNEGISGKTVKLGTNKKFSDKAITGSKNTNWTTTAEETVGASSTTVALDAGEYYRANPSLTGDFTILFNATMSDAIRFRLQGTDKSCSIATNTTALYRIKRVSGAISFEKSTDNGANWTTIAERETDTLTTETCQFQFYNNVASTERSLAYSNFSIIYSSEYSATTNADGTASFTVSDIAESGIYEFVAKYDDLSDDCTVTNALFYDDMVSTPASDTWVDGGNISSRDSTGTLLNNTTGSNQFYRCNKHNTSTSDYYDWDSPFVIEYDVVSINNPTSINSYIYDSSNDATIKTFNAIGATNGCHVKITYDGNVLKYIVDDVERQSISITTTNKFQIAFRLGNNSDIKIKDFMII